MRNAAIALVILLLAARVIAADWPHQRGPLNNGSVPPGTPVPEKLPDDPRVLWRVDVTDGFAAPVVSGGRVIYGDMQKGKETFHALRLDNGEPGWHHPLDAPHRDGFGTGPRCAPVSDGTIVLLQSCRGKLHCVDGKTGELLWEKSYVSDFDSTYVGEKGSTQGAARHGYAASPCIDGDHVITMAGGPGAGVVCLDKRNGDVVWKSQDDQAGYAPPRVVTIAGVRQVVCFTVDGVIGLDRADGGLLWRVPMKTAFGRHIAAPIIAGDLVIAGSHQVGFIATRVINDNGSIRAEQAWKLGADMGPNFASPVLVGDHLYMLAGNRVVCLEASSGETAWAKDGMVTTSKDRAFCAFVGMGERVMLLNDMGELILFEADPAECREISRLQVCGKNWCHPAYSGGKLVVRDGKRLVCVELLKEP